jgi:hypothetical protein
MTNEFSDLDRRIREKHEEISMQKDGERVIALSSELEQLFAQKDLLLQERNTAYRKQLRAS